MLEIFWGILNLSLFISFIIVCIKALKLVREKIGGFAAIIFGMGILLSFIPADKSENKFNLKDSEVHQVLNKNHTYKRIKLSENTLNTTWLSLTFSNELDLEEASLNRTGLIAFTDVSPLSIVQDKIGEGQFKYLIIYKKSLYLLGAEVYSKNFDVQNTIEL